jgi:hypothetical protein
MEMYNRNQSELLPYEKLAMLGIDREKADSLLMEVKEKLMSGEVTFIMQVSINARNGGIITMLIKLQVTTDMPQKITSNNYVTVVLMFQTLHL